LNITELKYLLEVANEKSISTAAKKLFVAQPNVSKAIKNLEEEYGIQLFERNSRGVIPTREGQRFIEHAKKVIDEIDNLNEQFHQTEEEKKVGLKISIPRATYASYAIVEYIKTIKDREQIQIHIRESNSLDALNYIKKHQYHLALIRYEVENEDYYKALFQMNDLEKENILDFHYQLLINENSPLAEKEIRRFSDLDGYIELIHGDTTLPNGEYLDLVQKPENENAEKRIHLYERGSQFALLTSILETYMWVSPMPEEVVQQNGLMEKSCPCQKKLMRDVLVYPRKEILGTEIQNVIEEIKKGADRVKKTV
jgi:DNA-binding transcriptional LysR family regulator